MKKKKVGVYSYIASANDVGNIETTRTFEDRWYFPYCHNSRPAILPERKLQNHQRKASDNDQERVRNKECPCDEINHETSTLVYTQKLVTIYCRRRP